MKIVCDACSAKYSIADDKVKGKVFKIRCKKCSNIIVVRGTGGAGTGDEPAPAQFDQKDTRVYDYGYDEAGGPAPGGGDEAVWHLVIDQEQVGPLTVAEVGEKFAAGQIDAESYVWREGFADWQPLSSVDAFAGVVGGGGAAAPAAAGGGARSSGADAVASMFGAAAPEEGGTVRSDPGDLFGARGGDAGAGDDAGDLFGARASAPAAAAAGGATMADGAAGKAAAKAADGKLRGERNENSVLFSLGNLAALASDSPRASAASSSSSSSSSGGASASSSSGGAAQHGGGEGSGLIDIRSMAGAYLGPQGAAKKPASSVGSIDDLPVFSAASFHEPAVILPTSGPRQNNKTMMIMIAAVGALALIAVILVLVVVLGNKSTPSTPPVAVNNGTGSASNKGVTPGTGSSSSTGTTPGTGSSSSTGTTPGTGSSSSTGTTPGTGSSSSAATPTGSDGGSDTGSKTGGDTGSKTGGDTGSKSGGDTGSSSKDHHHHDKAGEKTGGDKTGGDKTGGDKTGGDKTGGDTGGNCPDEVGCLLSEHPPSCCSKYSKGKKTGGSKSTGGDKTGGETSSGGGDLAESLDSDMIKSGVAGVKSRIFACGDKYPSAKGTVKVHVKVSPAGSVTDSSASQTPDPGLGSCAASAMKGAHFQKTQRGGTFSYPFNF